MQCKTCGSKLADLARFCPACGSNPLSEGTSAPEVRASQKASVRRVAMFLFLPLLIAGILIFAWYLNPSVHSVIKKQPVVTDPLTYDSNAVAMIDVSYKEEGGDLVFSLSELLRRRLVRFEYTGGQTPRPVMAYIAPTGQLVTAISVSEHCGSTEFKIKGNKIYCARCPSNWDMMTMEAYACCAKYHPDPIPSRVVGDKVHVAKVDVEKWAGRL